MIEQSEIDRIKQSTDLPTLIRARGVSLKRKGKQLVGLCPFHDDHEPSLIVDPKKQLWNCLGACSEGGDVYRWVMKAEGVDFRTAHVRLSGECGLQPIKAAAESQVEAATAEDLIWLERAVEHYHRRLLETPAAQDYLRARGITAPEFAQTFRLGYADDSLLQVLSPEGTAALKRIGVLTDKGRELMPGCVIFPLVQAASGQVVNLYGRHAGKPDQRSLPGAQHLYLPGVRRGVFNPQGARNAEEVIITESVIDAAAVWSAGLRNVIPAYGTNGLTDDLITHLQECRVKRVALMLDADDAGQHAAQLMQARLEAVNLSARSIELPVKDAAEFIAGGAGLEDLRALITPSAQAEAAPVASSFEKLSDGALRCEVHGREYRLRGLSAVGLERLKVNLRLSVNGAFHLDTIDLYQARARATFAQTAAKLCRVDESQVGADLLRLIEPLETARLAMKQAPDEPAPMTPAEREAALQFLRAADLCERIAQDFKRCGLEGERTTVLTAYLAAISRKLPEPLGVLIVARSGAGKSALQDALCGFLPPEDLVRVTRLTGQALFYKDPDSLQHKLLAIAEEEGAQQAVYSLRTLASDQQLSIAATRTDPQTGKLHTEHYQVHGPVSIIITTTSPEAFDEETRSRFAPLTLDESVRQTRAILERQRRRYSLQGVLEQATAEQVRRLHHNAQRLLRPLRVVNPFHELLTYPDERLIHRREQQKYLALINAVALLHQHQREIKRAATDEIEIEYVEVTLADIALANELTQATLSRALDELAPPVRGMYQEIRRLCEQRARELNCEPDGVQLSRREIRDATGWSDWQVRIYCQQLLDLEYLYAVSGANGKRFLYELAWYSPEEEKRPLLRGLVDVEQLRQQLKKNGTRQATAHV
jgi:DNA primase catalytic core